MDWSLPAACSNRGIPERGRDRLLAARESTDIAYIESFNGHLRAKCLNASWFLSLVDASKRIKGWK